MSLVPASGDRSRDVTIPLGLGFNLTVDLVTHPIAKAAPLCLSGWARGAHSGGIPPRATSGFQTWARREAGARSWAPGHLGRESQGLRVRSRGDPQSPFPWPCRVPLHDLV